MPRHLIERAGVAVGRAHPPRRRRYPEVHARPPSFCTGCPERPIFTAMKLVERELGPHHVSCDIGCHLFSILPPFNIGATTMGYGLGWAGAAAFNTQETDKRTISIMGDGGFWHNGLTSGVGNAVFNRSDSVLVVVDNSYTAATGGQDILSSQADNPIRTTRLSIADAVRGVGVKWVRTITRTYDVAGMRDLLKEALTTHGEGPESDRRAERVRAEPAAPREAVAAQNGRRRASAWCASVSASTPIPAPAITPASGSRVARR